MVSVLRRSSNTFLSIATSICPLSILFCLFFSNSFFCLVASSLNDHMDRFIFSVFRSFPTVWLTFDRFDHYNFEDNLFTRYIFPFFHFPSLRNIWTIFYFSIGFRSVLLPYLSVFSGLLPPHAIIIFSACVTRLSLVDRARFPSTKPSSRTRTFWISSTSAMTACRLTPATRSLVSPDQSSS